MTSSSRLRVSAIMILFSACYAVLVAQDREMAETVAIGYIAVVLSTFILVNLWKRS